MSEKNDNRPYKLVRAERQVLAKALVFEQEMAPHAHTFESGFRLELAIRAYRKVLKAVRSETMRKAKAAK